MSRSDNTPPPVERGPQVDYRLEKKPFSPTPARGLHSPREATGDTSDHIHVRAYSAPNWLTPAGVIRKRRLIELKGLPSFNKWRFITLTINRDLFPEGPLSAYLAGKDRMRRFMAMAREIGLWSKVHKWCWKLEFQEDGWPHWHLLVGRTRIFSEEELREIDRLWSLGRTNVEMVQEDDFRYSFKYAFKPVHQVDDEDKDFDSAAPMAPQWFLDFHQLEKVLVKWKDEDGGDHESWELKPTTGAKVRFFQSSRGFYTGEKPEVKPAQEPMSCRVPYPVRVIAERVASTVQLVARKPSGRYVASGLLLLSCSASSLWTLAGWHAINGGAVFFGVNSAVLPTQIIKQNTHHKWQLHPLLQQNRLTVRQAARLQTEGRNWQTC
ncbi:MAG TPA: hypothetical protein VFG14_01120 [Chthoniobacteraceae bacterium]|nr:hypothetical protein [Chthoniobacteraceae bacterium]